MAMKAIEKDPAIQNKNIFPCLMAMSHFDKVQIILATGKSGDGKNFVGINVNGVGNPIGFWSEGWSSSFRTWNGSVELFNITDSIGVDNDKG